MAISPPARAADDDVAGKQVKRTIWSGMLAGMGLVAIADETVFHQLLHWHYFYDKSTLAVGLVSDGLFHAGGFVPKRWWGALLLGAAAFQLYDGIVQHKLLGLHQIRYHVTLWPYDLTWNLIAAVMIAAGAALMTGRAGVTGSAMFRSDAGTAA